MALTDGSGAGNAGGAGLGIASGTAHLTGVTVSGNTAAGNATYGTGAGISIEDYLGDTDVTITDSHINGNQDLGGNGGGGIALFDDFQDSATPALRLTVTNTTVERQYRQGYRCPRSRVQCDGYRSPATRSARTAGRESPASPRRAPSPAAASAAMVVRGIPRWVTQP